MSDLGQALKKVAAPDRSGIPYLIGGSVSERQWNDVRGAVQGQRLDRVYLAQWPHI